MKKIYLLALVGLIIGLASCRKDNNKNNPTLSPATRTYSSVPLQNYFTLMCTITKATKGFFPPQAARAYGYVGIAAYEAVRNGISGAMTLQGQIGGLSNIPVADPIVEYNWAISSNAAVADMMRDMFDVNLTATTRAKIDSSEQANLTALSAGVNPDVVTRSVRFGKAVTQAIYESSKTDGGHQSYIDAFQLPYTLPVGNFCWVATNPAVPSPISPKWGGNRPFLALNITNVLPDDPSPFSVDASSAFYTNAMAVYHQVKNNTAEQVEIAKFWADDPFNTCTPAGHTFNIMTQLLKENSATLEKASVAFAKLSIAENDAFISCWKCKYKYDLIRPVSYIKKYIDATFATVIGTPAFPAYASGHSYESGAGSMIFTNMFADASGNYDFTDYSQVQYGFATRHYNNFNDLALECANSRFYAGIHVNEDNVEGLKMGKQVGDNVNKLIIWPTNLR